jgi:lipopolysaccharide transport system ATP-binding protein
MSVISVENLSKRYIIGHQRDSRDALRHALENVFRNPFRWLNAARKARQSAREDFWALREVSFEVNQGDAVGIIGRNGAGKSTLLKILSRITEPTSGRIHLKGRIASLLEVGTGFHQELSGRENIYLNGAILGMSKAEIKRKFDEIVAFSEVEQFLDTPVKRYSSGMYVRLAFAVAAHLEPEILIVDEVLAVGDAQFQKKCLGKMGQVAKGGRTVLFVSHNMPAVQALCGKALFLQAGRVKAFGEVTNVMNNYLSDLEAMSKQAFSEPLPLGPALKLLSFDFSPANVDCGAPLRWCLRFSAKKTTTFKDLALLINSSQGARVAYVDLRSLGFPITLAAGEVWQVEGMVKSLPLVEGDYIVGLTVNTSEFWENVLDLVGFSVNARLPDHGHPPHAAVYRGTVELDFTTSCQIVGTARTTVAAGKAVLTGQ